MQSALWFVVPALVVNAAGADAPADVLAKAPSHFATSADGKVHYKSLGEGTTAVVFVHGWCCDHTVWNDQAAALDGKVRCLFIDLPGYGKSDKPKTDYTIDLFARGVDAVLKDAGVQKAILVGHSMGTPVVRQVYRKFPEKVQALVFVDGSLRPFTRDPAETERFKGMFKEETFKEFAPKMLSGMFPPNAPAAAKEHIVRLVAAADPKVAISSVHGMMDLKNFTDDPIKVPAQALMAKSPMWTEDYKAYAKKLVQDLDYREFDGVGHFLFMEKPAEVDAALLEFLNKQGVVK
ncbi:MAG TPA: alpha/beta hydrolase [Gemmataceae bacterium]|jgi:pimeloyl-ACP methyl ester carboxylesterase|nr:alpha/beta hydrolase [Gemmataceae bacterium]